MAARQMGSLESNILPEHKTMLIITEKIIVLNLSTRRLPMHKPTLSGI